MDNQVVNLFGIDQGKRFVFCSGPQIDPLILWKTGGTDPGNFSAIFLQIIPGTKLRITVSRNSAPVRRYSRASSNFHFSRGNFGVKTGSRPQKTCFLTTFWPLTPSRGRFEARKWRQILFPNRFRTDWLLGCRFWRDFFFRPVFAQKKFHNVGFCFFLI